MTDEDRPPASEQPARVSQLDRVKQEYTQAAREILARSMRGVAKTKLTPDMLTLAGVSLCLAGAVLVGFEERNEKLFFWLGGVLFVIGSIADILDGALARAASKGTVFGAFLDSTFDRLGEAAMLAAIGLVFMRDGNEVALVATFAAVIGSFLVSYTRAKAEALGLRGDVGFGSRVERVVLISVGLGLAPWGWLQWPIYVLAAMAWITVSSGCSSCAASSGSSRKPDLASRGRAGHASSGAGDRRPRRRAGRTHELARQVEPSDPAPRGRSRNRQDDAVARGSRTGSRARDCGSSLRPRCSPRLICRSRRSATSSETLSTTSPTALPGPQRRALEVTLLREEPEGTAPDRGAIGVAFLSVLRALGERRAAPLSRSTTSSGRTPRPQAPLRYALRRLEPGRVVCVFLARRVDEASSVPLELDSPRCRRHRQAPDRPAERRALGHIFHAELESTIRARLFGASTRCRAGTRSFALELARAVGPGRVARPQVG